MYLGVHLNDKLAWTTNTDVLYKRGQSYLHQLTRLRSLRVCKTLLRIFYNSVIASTLFYTVVCWGGGCTNRDRRRIGKLVRKSSSVLELRRDGRPKEDVGRADNSHHPLHKTIGALSSSFSQRVKHPHCKKERFRRSFIPMAIIHYNASSYTLRHFGYA